MFFETSFSFTEAPYVKKKIGAVCGKIFWAKTDQKKAVLHLRISALS